MSLCPICVTPTTIFNSEGDSRIIDCPRCGYYTISRTAISTASLIEDRAKRRNASGWIRYNKPISITSDNIQQIFETPTPSFHDRSVYLLLALEKNTKHIGERISFNIDEPYWQGAAWCKSKEELWEFCNYLNESGLIQNEPTLDGSVHIKIAPLGWEQIESTKTANLESNQGLVAMWFNEEINHIYFDVIAPAITSAGYKPHRVDLREHNDKIDDEIIAQIRQSRFVVADFTGQRGGVYYEAGFAKGLNLEVFWTCRKDHLKELHFDIRQHNCIDWEPDKLDEFKRRLTNRIEAVLGRGTYRPDES